MQDKRCSCGNPFCKSAGKHPKTINKTGLKEASKDAAEIRRQFGFAGECNVAVRTGADSGFFVLDVDGAQGDESLSALQDQYGTLPATLTHMTGGGRHLLFNYPGFFVPNSISKIAPKLDIRGDGGYIIAAPSRHLSGVKYRFENPTIPIMDAPYWLLEMLLTKPVHIHDHDRLALPDFAPSDIRDMLDRIPADDYETWYQIGMALHHEGHSFETWNAWSSKSSKYTCAKDCMSHWRSFKKAGAAIPITIGSLVHMAQGYGWVPTTVYDPRMDSIVADILEADRKKKLSHVTPEKEEPKKVTLPKEKRGLIPPGLIGETVSWIVKTSIKPQPELALLNTLAAIGSIIGRRYSTEWDTRTNLYMIGIAGTGAGKDHSRKQIKKLMGAANLAKHLAGDGIVSDRGVLRGIANFPEQILHLDEIGLMLQVITGANAATHLRGISKTLMELYSSSSTIYNSGSYASNEIAPIVIDCPHLCVYGTTTMENYTSALTRNAVKDGSLNRFIVIPTSEDHPKRSRNITRIEPPSNIVERWRNIAEYMPPGNGDLQALNLPAAGAPNPQIVGWGDTIERIHDMGDYEDEMMISDSSHGALWNRYRENCIKIAMIIAICRNPLCPVIDNSDLDYAEDIIRRSVGFMTSVAEDHIADNPFERQCNLVIQIIREFGKKGATRSEIMRKARMKAKDLTDVLSSMAEGGRIYADGEPGKTTYVRWLVGG
jgi:hypothetical protein